MFAEYTAAAAAAGRLNAGVLAVINRWRGDRLHTCSGRTHTHTQHTSLPPVLQADADVCTPGHIPIPSNATSQMCSTQPSPPLLPTNSASSHPPDSHPPHIPSAPLARVCVSSADIQNIKPKDSTAPQRNKVTVSDGVYKCTALLASQLKVAVDDGRISRHCIMRITDLVGNKKLGAAHTGKK